MKYSFLFMFFYISLSCSAQERVIPTDTLIIEGAVKQPETLTLADLKKYPASFVDSIPVYNHLMVRKSALHKIKGILLKEVLNRITISSPGPKELSRYYITCVASDDYAVVFSWNELFNTPVGDQVLLIMQHDGQTPEQLQDRIAIISPADRTTGRRYVKGLKKIIIKHI